MIFIGVIALMIIALFLLGVVIYYLLSAKEKEDTSLCVAIGIGIILAIIFLALVSEVV